MPDDGIRSAVSRPLQDTRERDAFLECAGRCPCWCRAVRPIADGLSPAGDTRHPASPTPSATGNAPVLSIATPMGRPRASLFPSTKLLRITDGMPEGAAAQWHEYHLMPAARNAIPRAMITEKAAAAVSSRKQCGLVEGQSHGPIDADLRSLAESPRSIEKPAKHRSYTDLQATNRRPLHFNSTGPGSRRWGPSHPQVRAGWIFAATRTANL